MSIAGVFDGKVLRHACGLPKLRIAVGGVNYYPTLGEVETLSHRQGVTWPNHTAAFPPDGPALAFLEQVTRMLNAAAKHKAA